ncbi:hypothetical protein QLL95_gp0504 [Cotonvirus japonicus]|uniref:F-box domain-containing protein n=1 Tax=Cotonvirus japonicus TaxID=2811091 RepID=A0ABM7NU11_9VIRU|nr:hypothetical protein QLL95_gp0504 [Cotonvirus japonicus]BCS83619.1 hypothetical protein [Cotonvirus japonicus]
MSIMDHLYDDVALHICKYLTSKEIIYFLSINKTLNVLKNHVYYDEICDYKSIKNLEYYSRFRKIINVPHINDVSENVTYVCFSETFNDSIKDKLGKNINHIGFPENYDKNVYESPPNKINICHSNYFDLKRRILVWKSNYLVSNVIRNAAHFDSNLKDVCDFIINEDDTISFLNDQNHIITSCDLMGYHISLDDSKLSLIITNNNHINQDKINNFSVEKKINNISVIGSRTFVLCSPDKNDCSGCVYIFDSNGNFIDDFCNLNYLRHKFPLPIIIPLSIIPTPTKYIVNSDDIFLFKPGSYFISCYEMKYDLSYIYCFDYKGSYLGPILCGAGLPFVINGKVILRPYYKNNNTEIYFLSITNYEILLGSLIVNEIINI